MTERDNFWLTLVEHKDTGTIPNYGPSVVVGCGGQREAFENGPADGGFDDFGVQWEATASAGGAHVPLAYPIVLEDVTAWEDVVRFPDVDRIDWKGMAEEQLAGVDRNKVFVNYSAYNAQFLRVTHLMGFMEGLCAFSEEPEATEALMSAISDYKIRCIERIAEYFKPDFYTAYDDVATQHSLFISPTVYRELIKPQHKRVNDAARAYGMLPIMHTCGKCDMLIPDFIEEGAIAWTSAQPVNDICSVLDSYGRQISVIGGYDTNGRPGTTEATDEEVKTEVWRCLTEYAGRGSYVFSGLRLGGTQLPRGAGMRPILAAYQAYYA